MLDRWGGVGKRERFDDVVICTGNPQLLHTPCVPQCRSKIRTVTGIGFPKTPSKHCMKSVDSASHLSRIAMVLILWTSTPRESRVPVIEAFRGHEMHSPVGDDPPRRAFCPGIAANLCWTGRPRRRGRSWLGQSRWRTRFARVVHRKHFRSSGHRSVDRPFGGAFLWLAGKECFFAAPGDKSGPQQSHDGPAAESQHRFAATIASAASQAS